MPNYVIQRPSGYYLRFVVPTGYRHLLSTRELRYTLGTRSRRIATKRARAVVGRVDVLLGQMARGAVIPDCDDEIRETVRGYVEEAVSNIRDWHLHSPPRNQDEHEAHTGILLDKLQDLQCSLASSNFSGQVEAAVCKLFGLDAETVYTGDAQFRKACREWATATTQLYSDHLQLLDGEPAGGDTDYLRPAIPAVRLTAPPPAQVKPKGPRISEVMDRFLSDREKGHGVQAGTAEGYRQYVQAFVDLIGDLPVHDVTHDSVDEFREKLCWFPRKTDPGFPSNSDPGYGCPVYLGVCG